ncbi:MAG: hypothetical protein RMJ17_01055 [Candidatus Aenigmarchaeota archaeon]|nr:hypothetical protein [Candidatus Aenigmarchaeota archaeon]MDW8149174.1 hypothetical protein [Candidatus Aenigmarchaeota archaeon]
MKAIITIKISITPGKAGFILLIKSLNNQKRKIVKITKTITFKDLRSLFIDTSFFMFKKYAKSPESASLISLISLIVKTRIDVDVTTLIILIKWGSCILDIGAISFESGMNINLENRRTIPKKIQRSINFGKDFLNLTIDIK